MKGVLKQEVLFKIKHGYVYFITIRNRGNLKNIAEPCFMGIPGHALLGCRKLTNKDKLKLEKNEPLFKIPTKNVKANKRK